MNLIPTPEKIKLNIYYLLKSEGENSPYPFHVRKDKRLDVSSELQPLANVFIQTISLNRERSGKYRSATYTASIAIDLHTSGIETETENSDEVSANRLGVLVQQVMDVLNNLKNAKLPHPEDKPELELNPNQIEKEWCEATLIAYESAIPVTDKFCDARVTVDVHFIFEPLDQEFEKLTDIQITEDQTKYQALYNYEEP